MIRSHIGSVINCGVVLKFERLSHLSCGYFGLGLGTYHVVTTLNVIIWLYFFVISFVNFFLCPNTSNVILMCFLFLIDFPLSSFICLVMI